MEYKAGSIFLHESMEEGKWVQTDISRDCSERIQASRSPFPFVSTTTSVFIAQRLPVICFISPIGVRSGSFLKPFSSLFAQASDF